MQTNLGALILPLPYRAEQNIPSVALLTQQVSGNIAAANVNNHYFVDEHGLLDERYGRSQGVHGGAR